MRREIRVRIRIPRSTAQLTLVAALLAWPGSVLCPVQQSAVLVSYVADPARPMKSAAMYTNQKTVLGAGGGSILLVPGNFQGNCYPAENGTKYGCTADPGSPNPSNCGVPATIPNSSALFLPAADGASYNNSGTGAPSCYNPMNSGPPTPATTNPLRRVYVPNLAKAVVGGHRAGPDVLRVDGDLRVDELCFWNNSGAQCKTYFPFEFTNCGVSGSCSAATTCMPGTSPPACSTSGTGTSNQTVDFEWTVPGSTSATGVDLPWVFRHGIVGLQGTGTTCTVSGGTPVGCEIGFPLPQSDPPAGYTYPAASSTSRPSAKTSTDPGADTNYASWPNNNSFLNPSGETVNVYCRIWFPETAFSQTKAKCHIVIPVQNNPQSTATYKFAPTSLCMERYPSADPRFVACPLLN